MNGTGGLPVFLGSLIAEGSCHIPSSKARREDLRAFSQSINVTARNCGPTKEANGTNPTMWKGVCFEIVQVPASSKETSSLAAEPLPKHGAC